MADMKDIVFCSRMPYQEVLLNRYDFSESMRVDSNVISDARFDCVKEINNTLLFRLHAHIYGEDHTIVSFRHPDGFWQYFKESFFCKYLLRKFPIKYKCYSYSVNFLYPNIKPSIPGERNIMYVKWNEK